MVWVFAEIAIVLAIVGFVIWWITRPPARGDKGEEKGEAKSGKDPDDLLARLEQLGEKGEAKSGKDPEGGDGHA